MPDYVDRNEPNNLKAVLVGLFLIILIATITILKSNFGKEKTASPNTNEAVQPETIDETKIKKITADELAKKITAEKDLVVIDLREELSFKAEHIIDSLNTPLSNITSFFSIAGKNRTYVLVETTGDELVIKTVAKLLSEKGYAKLFYLDGGFATWKNTFNRTITDGDQKSFTDQAKVSYITSDDLKKKLETEKNIVLVDVRQNNLFGTGHLKGAVNIPLDDLEKKRNELPAGKNIVLYDDTVLGAFKGAVRLFDLGFTNVLALSDGLDSWKNKGYEIIK